MKRILLVVAIMLAMNVPALAQWGTASAMFSTVRERLGVAATDTSRFPNSKLYSMLNEAMQAVCVDVGAYRKMGTITTATGTAMYTAPTDAIEGWPIDIISYHPNYKTKKYVGLTSGEAEEMNEENDKREMIHSAYVHDSTIVIYPPTPLPNGTLYIFYRARCPEISKDTNTVLVGAEDRRAVIHYTCYLAALASLWVDRAAIEWELYQWHVTNRKVEMIKPTTLPVGP